MGRPRTIDPTGKDRGTAAIKVRLTEAQREALEAAAAEAGVSISETVRRTVVQHLEAKAS